MLILSLTMQAQAQDNVEPDVVFTSRHTYYFDAGLPSELPEERTIGGVTWAYDGQQLFHEPGPDCDELDRALDPVDLANTGVWFGEEQAPTHPELARTYDDALWDTVKVDHLGRRWIVAAIDPEGLQQHAEDYAARVAARYDTEWPSWDVAADLAREIPEEPEVHAVDFVWHDNDCDGLLNSSGQVTYWETDDRDEMTPTEWATASEAALSTVVIYYNDGTTNDPDWGPICSGAYVDDYDVLTAAHCLWDGGYKQAASKFKVCTEGNYGANSACFSVFDTTLNPYYTGGSVMGNDYGVMQISASATSDFMALSSHTSAQLWDLEIRHWASAGWKDADQDPCVSGWRSAANNVGGQAVNTLTSVFDEGPALEVTSTVLGTGVDAGEGQSGGAQYVWVGSVPTHVGVMKGWCPLPTYNGGPRTSNIRSWILANI